jgi:carnosine N-methyltransferase
LIKSLSFQKLRFCIDENYNAIRKIIDGAETLFDNDDGESYKTRPKDMPVIRAKDIEKVQITLKQIFRDWSVEGRKEREQCYKPILDEIHSYFGDECM